VKADLVDLRVGAIDAVCWLVKVCVWVAFMAVVGAVTCGVPVLAVIGLWWLLG
jgi:hypothetical protein